MERPHFRPRLVLLVRDTPEGTARELHRRLRAAPGLEGRARTQSVLAWIAQPRRRLWSPCLDVNLRPHPEGTVALGAIGPHPKLMTAYVFLAIGLSFLAALGCTGGFVQWRLGEAPLLLCGAIPGALGLVGLLAFDRLGRRWGHDQMLELAALLDELGEVRAEDDGLLQEAHRWRHTAPPPPPRQPSAPTTT